MNYTTFFKFIATFLNEEGVITEDRSIAVGNSWGNALDRITGQYEELKLTGLTGIHIEPIDTCNFLRIDKKTYDNL